MYGIRHGYLEHLTTRWVWDQPGMPDIPDTGGVLVVHPNGHLEAGKRIEKWYPEFPFKVPAPQPNVALFRTTVGKPPYVVAFCCHMGYMEGNLLPGIWARMFQEIEQHIAPVLIVAADRDVEFAEAICKIFDPTMSPCFNAPLPEVCNILMNARATIGVASGITILSTYYGIPTLHGYPRHLAAMPGTWEHGQANTAACMVDELPFVSIDLLSRLLARTGQPHAITGYSHDGVNLPASGEDPAGRGDVAAVSEQVSAVDDTRSELDRTEETGAMVGSVASNGHGISVAPWLHDPGVRPHSGGR